MTIRTQRGVSTVEFAIVAAVLMMMMFGVFEVGRAYYTYSILDEVTRRGARLAAVCPVNDPAISRLAVFNAPGDIGDSSLVMGLAPDNVAVEYLDANGTTVTDPSSPVSFMQIRYVRVRIVGFVHRINVPFAAGLTNIVMPALATVVPRESLGVPREGAITPC